jgi:hypothetical protein
MIWCVELDGVNGSALIVANLCKKAWLTIRLHLSGGSGNIKTMIWDDLSNNCSPREPF